MDIPVPLGQEYFLSFFGLEWPMKACLNVSHPQTHPTSGTDFLVIWATQKYVPYSEEGDQDVQFHCCMVLIM